MSSHLMSVVERCATAAVGAAVLLLLSPKGVPAAEPKTRVLQDLRRALLLYEGCESRRSPNAHKGVKISGTIVEGRIGKGVLIERRTENLVRNPDFASFEDWIEIGRPRRLSGGGHASPSCAAVGRTRYLRQVVEGLKPGALYCLSVYARAASPGAGLELRVDREPSKVFTLSRTFERVVLPFTAAHDLSTITLRGRGTGEAVVDGVQLEGKRDYPSSFLKGGRREVQMIEVRVGPQTLDPDAGTVVMWFKPLWIGRTSESGQNLFGWGNKKDSGPYHLVTLVYPLGDVQDHDWKNKILLLRTAETRHAVGSVGGPPISPRWRPDTWHHLAATWKVNPGALSSMALYLDGELVAEKPVAWGENKAPTFFCVGQWGGGYADAVIDEVYIFDRPLNAEEVSFIHDLRTPLSQARAVRR